MDKKELIKQAKTLKGCNPGMLQLKESNTIEELIKCYYDRIDFCLVHNFPSNEYIKRFGNGAEKMGIYVDKKWKLHNPNTIVLLGKSDFEVSYDGFAVARIYAKHKTTLHIKAGDNAFVIVDALDDVEVRADVTGEAKVVVSLYGNADCLGATKIIKKNRETYELTPSQPPHKGEE